jgi:energy-coupling factor transport system permease protein
MFTYLASASPLHRLNPSAKLLGLALIAAGATLAFDPFVPTALLLGLWLTTLVVGKAPLSRMLRWSVPILLLPLPLAIFTALYADLSRFASPTILWAWGPWRLSSEGILIGVGLGLRVSCFMGTSLLFISTTDPTDFAISLIQNLKVPYRFGYGVLISYRFLPLLRTELETIRLAHKVRGVGRSVGLLGRWREMRRMALPLLASAIRHSERTALAMDAKAFGAGSQRTYFRQMKIKSGDGLFVLSAAAFCVAVYAVATRLGVADLQWIPGA